MTTQQEIFTDDAKKEHFERIQKSLMDISDDMLEKVKAADAAVEVAYDRLIEIAEKKPIEFMRMAEVTPHYVGDAIKEVEDQQNFLDGVLFRIGQHHARIIKGRNLMSHLLQQKKNILKTADYSILRQNNRDRISAMTELRVADEEGLMVQVESTLTNLFEVLKLLKQKHGALQSTVQSVKYQHKILDGLGLANDTSRDPKKKPENKKTSPLDDLEKEVEKLGHEEIEKPVEDLSTILGKKPTPAMMDGPPNQPTGIDDVLMDPDPPGEKGVDGPAGVPDEPEVKILPVEDVPKEDPKPENKEPLKEEISDADYWDTLRVLGAPAYAIEMRIRLETVIEAVTKNPGSVNKIAEVIGYPKDHPKTEQAKDFIRYWCVDSNFVLRDSRTYKRGPQADKVKEIFDNARERMLRSRELNQKAHEESKKSEEVSATDGAAELFGEVVEEKLPEKVSEDLPTEIVMDAVSEPPKEDPKPEPKPESKSEEKNLPYRQLEAKADENVDPMAMIEGSGIALPEKPVDNIKTADERDQELSKDAIAKKQAADQKKKEEKKEGAAVTVVENKDISSIDDILGL